MAVHSGGKVGKAGKTLATKSSSKSIKSKAGKTLADHKAKKHQFCEHLSHVKRPNLSFVAVEWVHQMKERFFTHEKKHY